MAEIVTGEYVLTAEHMAESLQARAMETRSPDAEPRRRWLPWIIGLALGLVISLFLVLLYARAPQQWLRPSKQLDGVETLMAAAAIAFAIVLGGALTGLARQPILTPPHMAPNGPAVWQTALTVMGVVLLAAGLLTLPFLFHLSRVNHWVILAALLPYAAHRTVAMLRHRWLINVFTRHLADAHNEGGPIRLKASDESLTVLRAHRMERCAWTEFVSYQETASLIVLYTPTQEVPVLKSAFADPEALMRFRALVAAKLSIGAFLPPEDPAVAVGPKPSASGPPASLT
jgi:hypothetical protein